MQGPQATPESIVRERAARLTKSDTPDLAGAMLIAIAIAEGLGRVATSIDHFVSRWETTRMQDQFRAKP